MEDAIEVRDLRKRYGDVEAVRGIDFSVRRGEVFGLLGPNGAGKTTTVEILEGYRDRTEGEVEVLGLVGDPELIFLDEPTTGFDPVARRQAWDTIRSLRELGKTVLLTTHYLDEAQSLADRVAIIKDGAILADGPPRELGAGAARYRISYRGGEHVTDDPTTLLHELTAAALARGERLEELSVTRPSLEDVYLELTE